MLGLKGPASTGLHLGKGVSINLNKFSIRSDTYKGCKVRYLNANGDDQDTISANEYIVPGQIYTIDYEIVHRWQTDVYLEEVEGIGFNRVMFKNIKKRTKNPAGKSPS